MKIWFLLAVIGGLASGCRTQPVATSRFEFDRPEMGLPFRIVLYAPDAEHARTASEAAFSRIAQLNAILSDYEEESELSRLSRSSGSHRAVPVSADRWTGLVRADQVSRASDGAFDITVGPLVQLWKRARRQRQLPPHSQLETALKSVGWQSIELDHRSRTAQLTQPGMRLDPGGIAKGYALDEAARTLRAAGVRRFLVSGGGDMVAGEPPPDQPGWRVEVGVFDTTPAPAPRFVALRRQALATSGDVFQRAEIGGIRYSHIVNPHTGIGLTDHGLVTLIGPEGMTVDALSKVVSVLGPVEGLAKLRGFRGVEALVLRKPGTEVQEDRTPGFGRWLWPH